ncbi:GNAT family N-acetyltransferase [Metabacillus indicus]|uniref:GNAT family N-acetyltransferase n=1 Tax=Metabacillus indicus TaxID=246786 RepID=UPI002A04E36F|nr:GNAT family N-acetyltransferase [Metabacillus indicus]MDX8290800.1 GNAT family N-acetyltransferase [Metabacillus indicus]
MNRVLAADIADLNRLVEIDSEVIGHSSRREIIKRAIENGQCLIAKEEEEIAGFLIHDTSFFECAFISLVIVSPSKRRRGFASLLIDYMVSSSATEKIFSSTNRSNTGMQKVFHSNGFVESGMVENLDEGDPEVIYFKKRTMVS